MAFFNTLHYNLNDALDYLSKLQTNVYCVLLDVSSRSWVAQAQHGGTDSVTLSPATVAALFQPVVNRITQLVLHQLAAVANSAAAALPSAATAARGAGHHLRAPARLPSPLAAATGMARVPSTDSEADSDDDDGSALDSWSGGSSMGSVRHCFEYDDDDNYPQQQHGTDSGAGAGRRAVSAEGAGAAGQGATSGAVAQDEVDSGAWQPRSGTGVGVAATQPLRGRGTARACGVRVNKVLLVGGFASSPYLQSCLAEALAGRVDSLVVPPQPHAAVLRGAGR